MTAYQNSFDHCIINIEEDEFIFEPIIPTNKTCSIGHTSCPISKSDLDAPSQRVSQELEDSWMQAQPNYRISCSELWIVADPPPSVRYLPTEVTSLRLITAACKQAYPYLDMAEEHLNLIAHLTIMRRLSTDQYYTASYVPASYVELTQYLPDYISYPWLMATFIEAIISLPTHRGIYVPDIKWTDLPPSVHAEDFQRIIRSYVAISNKRSGEWKTVGTLEHSPTSPLITASYHPGSICSDFRLTPVLVHLAGFFCFRKHESSPIEGCDMSVHHLFETHQCITYCVRRMADSMTQKRV